MYVVKAETPEDPDVAVGLELTVLMKLVLELRCPDAGYGHFP